MRVKSEILEEWLERIENEGCDLTDWEQDFITSVRDQFDRRGTLSDKQIDVVERIYGERVG